MRKKKLILMSMIFMLSTTLMVHATPEKKGESMIYYLEIPDEYCATLSDKLDSTKLVSNVYLEEIDAHISISAFTNKAGLLKLEKVTISNVQLQNSRGFSDCVFACNAGCLINPELFGEEVIECFRNCLSTCLLEAILDGQ